MKRRPLALLLGATLMLAACSSEDTSREGLVTTLMTQANLDAADANCVANEIFGISGFTADQINDASSKPDEVTSDAGRSFNDLVDESLTKCGIGN